MDSDSDAASSSSPLVPTKHDVFISFKGEDTRSNFASHLYASLCRKQITVYIDDQTLERGQSISATIHKAIEESKLSIVIFSEGYADSAWCLNELVHILGCKERHGQIVIPVFYHVEPSVVRKQVGIYGRAFAKHESRFGDQVRRKWKDALAEAANIAGWVVSTFKDESKLIEELLNHVIQKLNRITPSDEFKGLVGIDKRVEKVKSLLDISSSEVCIVGIWGTGGIGKTALAEAVFNRVSFEFEASCFLPNVSEELKRNKKQKLKETLFQKLLEEPMESISIELSSFHRMRLGRKRVLIILDDVDDIEQFEYVAGNRDWYGHGSRIIITSRNRGVFRSADANEIYEVTGLDYDEALHLFNLNAFKTNSPDKDYSEVSKMLVNHANGIPLALKVLGSIVYGKSREMWYSTLDKLKRVPLKQVQTVLKTSYDGLDEEEKIIFLDIVCFFKGNKRDFVERILDGCGFSTMIIIKNLIEKSLITIIDSDKLWMQNLIEEMGRQIVRDQCTEEPGERSRLWDADDIYHAFKFNTQTAAVEGIFLDMCRIKNVDLCPTSFLKMYNLRMLKLHSRLSKCMLHFPQGLEILPDALRYLHWDAYPFKSLPLNFTGEHLVELIMQHSKIQQLWPGEVQILKNLKVIDLSFSNWLLEIPDLSQASGIVSVSLRFCKGLREVPAYFQHLKKLSFLNLEGCSSLEEVSALPPNIREVNLNCCESLKSLPRNIPMLKSLTRLELSGCSSFEYTNFREILDFLESLD